MIFFKLIFQAPRHVSKTNKLKSALTCYLNYSLHSQKKLKLGAAINDIKAVKNEKDLHDSKSLCTSKTWMHAKLTALSDEQISRPVDF